MDSSAIRAAKLAGLLLLAAGMSGCVVASYSRRLGTSHSQGAPTAIQYAASTADASDPPDTRLVAATDKADSAGTLVLDIPEIPLTDPVGVRMIEVPFELEPALNDEPSRQPPAHAEGFVAHEPAANSGSDPSETAIPELPGADGDVAGTDEPPGKACVRSNTEPDPVDDVAAEVSALDDEAPGRAFVCDNAEPAVVYQELPVAIPAERWPGYSPGNGPGNMGSGRRRNVIKRQITGSDSATRGIVRYVDQAQGLAQVVFAGMTLVEPGTCIAVQHQLLFGRLTSTEFVEVVSSAPGAAIVRPIGNGRITKTAIGDKAFLMNE
ncbi:MAG TPA: hypothetical protein VGH74_18155 [Planctomycetaceae bacterium]